MQKKNNKTNFWMGPIESSYCQTEIHALTIEHGEIFEFRV